jgi:hypothetical protein
VSLFKTRSFYCNTYDEGIGLSTLEIEALIFTEMDCLNYGGIWDRHILHFDNIFAGMI